MATSQGHSSGIHALVHTEEGKQTMHPDVDHPFGQKVKGAA